MLTGEDDGLVDFRCTDLTNFGSVDSELGAKPVCEVASLHFSGVTWSIPTGKGKKEDVRFLKVKYYKVTDSRKLGCFFCCANFAQFTQK